MSVYLNGLVLTRKHLNQFVCFKESMKRYCGSVDFDVAVNVYGEVAKVDPFNLDNMDTYSNILYVKVCTTSDDDVMK